MKHESIEAFCLELEEARKLYDTTLLGDAATTLRELCQIIDYQWHRTEKLTRAVKDSIEALERGSTSAPILESLKAAVTP